MPESDVGTVRKSCLRALRWFWRTGDRGTRGRQRKCVGRGAMLVNYMGEGTGVKSSEVKSLCMTGNSATTNKRQDNIGRNGPSAYSLKILWSAKKGLKNN